MLKGTLLVKTFYAFYENRPLTDQFTEDPTSMDYFGL
jgi:hypothetical protein